MNVEDKRAIEDELLDQFEKECNDDLEGIRMHKASMRILVEHYKAKYDIDFSDECDDMMKDA